jgi:hypothetical protein
MKWIKPDCDTSACLEILPYDGQTILMRATEFDGGSALLLVERPEFAAFISAAKNGKYDEFC